MVRRGGRGYRRSKPRVEPEPTILIVSEGEKTEPKYLEELRGRLHLVATRVEILKADGTDPSSIVNHAVAKRDECKQAAKRGEGVKYEAVWVVFDSEQRLGTPELDAVLRRAAQEGIFVAMSAPCFEYWLILHFEYTTAYLCSCLEAERKLKQHVPDYDKSDPPLDALMSLLGDAVRNSVLCRREQDKAGAELPRTDVDLLVLKMNRATRPHHRLFECSDEDAVE